MKKFRLTAKIILGILGVSTVIAAAWTGAYFASKLIFHKFGAPSTEYVTQLIIMLLQFVFLFCLMAIISFATRGQERVYIPIITAIRQISKGDFKVVLDNDRRYGQFNGIVEGINEMASELSRMETMRQDFISNVSHEIQSPLTSIRGFARALRNESLSSGSRSHYLDIIEAESTRLSGLSENLLKLSALEADSFPFERKAYRLDKQLREMILVAEPQWLGKTIEVEAELEEIHVYAVEDLMSQVWTNLLHNSIKFTPEGGCIHIRLYSLEKTIEVEIKDSGIGIAEEELSRIFERFYKVDQARTTSEGGSGLGLSLVKKIVEIHEGSVAVRSRPGEGTVFVVSLPLQIK
ncbi:two-component sensor histidine kinase [Paenibacillus sp. 19GGS1-52]|uniref:sensor histidine kinase n=1 Tax=Paenibacillus sp. 19GGS1-52 TaxID=2758563 RepID=UPI001EFA5057|nr:HAMP domain-containing sensor histidine kinase [Paenibacillus sp. 19GGS1-52]ULO07880.1 two-component sensor histidine kinase [Paenibacillus sp. 19GGS1-52]